MPHKISTYCVPFIKTFLKWKLVSAVVVWGQKGAGRNRRKELPRALRKLLGVTYVFIHHADCGDVFTSQLPPCTLFTVQFIVQPLSSINVFFKNCEWINMKIIHPTK